MKLLNPILIILFSLFLFSCTSFQKSKSFKIENELFSKTFHFSKSRANKISVQLFDKIGSKELNKTSQQPYFEFVINNQIVSSNDKLWVFRSEANRKMENGGTEHILTFEGVKENVNGLQVVITQQIFPNSTLMREKLELKANDKSFTLNSVCP